MSGKILIYRRGSIGDAIVSIPALNLLRHRYTDSEIRILTNQPVMERAAPLASILEKTALCDGIFTLPPGGGGFQALREAKAKIASWGPDTVIYLSEPSRPLGLLREYLFFRSCGIRRHVGFPWGSTFRTYREKKRSLWESETERLLRVIQSDGASAPDWSFEYTPQDISEADNITCEWDRNSQFIALSVGAKLPDKDWGDKNWRAVLSHLADKSPNFGMMAIGAIEEKARFENLLADWPGPVLNLCGRTSPLVSSLAMRDAAFYLGHDSGPMHLAALAKVRCVAVFSARAKPGVWFPHGEGHEILYPWNNVAGVPAKTGLRTAGSSIQSIKPEEVIHACERMLSCAA